METKEKNIVVQSVAATGYQIRTENHQGKAHIVVPVVMMVEGVHNGSRGPLFHSAQELGKVVGAWNGIPITIQHPQQGDSFISANSPDQIERCVGRVYNVHMDGNKLKGEAWIDVNKITAVSTLALGYIRQQRPLDVSVGVFTEETDEEGDWNGEHYTATAYGHRPDHLALLPGEQGACSWADGCGIRVNSSQTTKTEKDEMKKEEKFKVLKDLQKEGFALTPMANEAGFREVMQNVREKLDGMDNSNKMYFLEEMYDNRVIYRVSDLNTDSSILYQTEYSVNDGKVEFTGDAKEVRKEVSYQTMSSGSFRRTKFNINKNDQPMNKKVEALIANTECKFTNCDREWLEGLSDAKLDDLVQKHEKQEPPKAPELDVNTAISFLKENAPKQEDVLALLSKEAQEAHTLGLKLYQEKKTAMISAVTSNSDAWTEDELKAMDFNLLDKISKSVQPAGDFSAMGAGNFGANAAADDDDDDNFMARPQVNFAKKQ
jgi:hypothetical protein